MDWRRRTGRHRGLGPTDRCRELCVWTRENDGGFSGRFEITITPIEPLRETITHTSHTRRGVDCVHLHGAAVRESRKYTRRMNNEYKSDD